MQNKNQNNTQVHYNAKKIKNWNEYDQALENRGNFSVWLDVAMLNNQIEQTGKPGHPFEYSDALILFLAQIREFMRQPLRQTIGVATAIFKQAGIAISLPDHVTLGRRMGSLKIPTNLDKIDFNSPIIFLPDSTGLKISGEGEWKVKKHGADKRREWVKVHLGVDYNTGAIVASSTTNERRGDSTELPALLKTMPACLPSVREVVADGAYDTKPLYTLANARGFRLIVPPPKNAVWRGKIDRYGDLVEEEGYEVRNNYVQSIMFSGREEWKKQIGYHRRSLAETAMFRLKRTFGDHLRSRTKRNQAAEISLRISLLNLFTSYGMPKYST